MRVGIDAEHLTYREAGLRAQDAGVAYVALHGRTAAQYYGGHADWDPIADLVELLDIPVLGNGDIWEAEDAVRMVRGHRLRRRGRRAAAASAGRGCSPTWPPRSRGQPHTRAARPGPGGRGDVPARRAAGRLARRGARRDRLPQARRLVPQGILGRQRAAGRAGDGIAAWPSWPSCWPSSTRPAVPGRASSASPRGRTTGDQQVHCRRAGWPIGSPARCRSAPSWSDSGG